MKKIIIFLGVFLLMAAIVYAATLAKQAEVQSCFDTDSGVVVTLPGQITGLELSGSSYNMSDACASNTTLVEYACHTRNSTVFKQQWNQNCAQLNKTCRTSFNGGYCG